MITLAQLVAAGVTPTPARIFLDPLNAAFERFEINTPERMAGFLAQAMHESMDFTHLEENLFYTKPERIVQIFKSVPTVDDAIPLTRNPKGLASRVYANRLGNGDEASGDGWRYRGRGLFQLTGRDNYLAAMMALDRDYLENPDLVAQPEDAALTAGWYWHRNGLNELADQKQIDVITKRVNGPAMLGARERREDFFEALVGLA